MSAEREQPEFDPASAWEQAAQRNARRKTAYRYTPSGDDSPTLPPPPPRNQEPVEPHARLAPAIVTHVKHSALLLCVLLAGCPTEVVTFDDSEPASLECTGDVAECAIDHFEQHVGPLSETCTEVARATEIVLVGSAEIQAACGLERVVGCVASYNAAGATVLVSNVSGRRTTEIHEIVHVLLRCARGDFDSSHSKYARLWADL